MNYINEGDAVFMDTILNMQGVINSAIHMLLTVPMRKRDLNQDLLDIVDACEQMRMAAEILHGRRS